MTISLAGSASAATRPGALAALHPDQSVARHGERLKPEQTQPEVWSPERAYAACSLALPWPSRSAGFVIHQLLAAAPELGASRPNRRATLAAYEAHLARRISYSGPVSPVDLRV